MNILRRLSSSNPKHHVIAHYHAYQDGVLTEVEAAAYQQHLDSCRYCQQWVDEQPRFAQKLRSEEPPQAVLSPAASARIEQNIVRQMRRAMIMNNIRSTVSAAAAFVVLAVVVGFFLGRYRDAATEEPVEPAATAEEVKPEIATQAGTIDEQLVAAVGAQDTAAVERLLEAGADPNLTTSGGDPILKTACFAVGSSLEIIELLLEHGADVNAVDKDGNPLLPQVARRPQPELVQLLLDAGADVNSTMTTSGSGVQLIQAPALIHAVLGRQQEVLEVLIANGADVNQAEKANDDTALHIAAYNNAAGLVKVLLESGADPSPLSSYGGGQTPLDFAAVNGSMEALQALLDGGVDVDGTNGLGQTAMMTAIKEARSALVTELVSAFLANGADPNKQDDNGNTALHHAARWGKADVIPLLIESGVDPNLENNNGKTALDLAVDEPVIELLSEMGPTPVSPFTEGSIGPGQQQAYSFISSSGEEIIFWLYLPEAYDDSQSWPLIISLHGFLGFEPSLERVREQSPPAFSGTGVEFPFIVISPRAPSGSWALYHEPMEELVELVGESVSIDPDAQFLTGLSAGAIGVWQWALAFPDRFTGIALIAGSLSLNPDDPVPENICLLKDLPVWVANSEADRDAPIESHRAAVMALEECGSTVTHFTVYADLNHVDSFSVAYAGPELYDWMLALMDEGS